MEWLKLFKRAYRHILRSSQRRKQVPSKVVINEPQRVIQPMKIYIEMETNILFEKLVVNFLHMPINFLQIVVKGE